MGYFVKIELPTYGFVIQGPLFDRVPLVHDATCSCYSML